MEKFRKTKTYKIFGYFYLKFIIALTIIVSLKAIRAGFFFYIFSLERAKTYFLECFFSWFGLICIVVFIVMFCITFCRAKDEPQTKTSITADIGHIIMLIITVIFCCNIIGNVRNIGFTTSSPIISYGTYGCKFLNENMSSIVERLDSNFTEEQFYNELKNINSVLRAEIYSAKKSGKVIDFDYKCIPLNCPLEISIYYRKKNTEYVDLLRYKFTKPKFLIREEVNNGRIVFKRDVDKDQICDINKKNCYIYSEGTENCRFYYDNNKKVVPSKEATELLNWYNTK